MESIFRSLIEVLTDIRSPLMFWGFRLIIFVFAFYLFSKHSDWYIKTINPIIKKLTRNNLFKITRLIAILIFVLFLVSFVLSFIAPILNNIVEKKYNQDVISEIVETKEEIVQTITQDNKYKQIISLYEAGNFEQARLIIEETFRVKSLNSDKLKGYIVAAYFGNRDYKNAAIQVLERDKTKPVWDLSLKGDFAQCIRNYSIKNGLLAGVELTKELQNKYGKKLTSVFWTAIPVEYLRAINEGYYSRSMNLYTLEERNKQDIKQLINLYPNDLFIDHGFYAIQEFDSLLKKYPNSAIKDLALFGLGYEIISDLRLEYNGNYDYSDYYFMQKLLPYDSLQIDSTKFKNAIEYFTQYLNISTKLPQSDDVCYWLGWIYAQKREFDVSLEYLLQAQNYGNKDFSSAADEFQYYILNFIPIEKRITYLKIIEDQKKKDSEKNLNNYLVNKSDPIEAMHIVLSDTTLSRKTLINNIVENQLKDYGNLENCIKLYELYNASISNELLKEVYSITTIDSIDNKLIKRVTKIKNNPHCRILSFQIIDRLLQKTSNSDLKGKLKFLKIGISEIEYPEISESLANEFLKNHSKHILADDVLAELIYIQSYILSDFEKAEKYLRILQTKYPNGNANDNAMYWIAYAYEHSKDQNYILMSTTKYKDVISRYPSSRFARYARTKLKII